MDDFRSLSSGLAGCCKTARLGGGLPACEGDSDSLPPRPWLPPDIVRAIDSLARQMERKEVLMGMLRKFETRHDAGELLWMVAEASATQDAKLLVDAGVTVTPLEARLKIMASQAIGIASLMSFTERPPSIDDKMLRWYALLGHADEVKNLLDKGADPRDSFALDMAMYCGHDAVIALLTAAAAAEASAE